MKRREFSLTSAYALAASTLVSPAVFAQSKPTEYQVLDAPIPTETGPGTVEVIEFFWYSCQHCNTFEPKLEAWVKRQPKDVVLRRIPVAFQASFEPQQRLFYTLEAMDKIGSHHGKVFHSIHFERNPLQKEDQIFEWAAKQGLDAAKFKEMFNSFAVQSKTRRARQVQDIYKVPGVPGLAVAGRYYTDSSLAGSMDRALEIVDQLVAQSRPKTSPKPAASVKAAVPTKPKASEAKKP